MRLCVSCGQEKSPTEYGRDKRSKDGCKAKCRSCEREYMRSWQAGNRDRVNDAQMRRYQGEREARLSAAKERYAVHRERILAAAKTPRALALGRARKAAERVRRIDVLRERDRRYAKQNIAKRRAYASQPHMRVHSNISRSIRAALMGGKNGRGWEGLLGYTRADLVAHLERQFVDGMTWENYGQWEIDHIRPRASFRFRGASDPEFLDCWSLENLQPLWMSDNRKKGARLGVAA